MQECRNQLSTLFHRSWSCCTTRKISRNCHACEGRHPDQFSPKCQFFMDSSRQWRDENDSLYFFMKNINLNYLTCNSPSCGKIQIFDMS